MDYSYTLDATKQPQKGALSVGKREVGQRQMVLIFVVGGVRRREEDKLNTEHARHGRIRRHWPRGLGRAGVVGASKKCLTQPLKSTILILSELERGHEAAKQTKTNFPSQGCKTPCGA